MNVTSIFKRIILVLAIALTMVSCTSREQRVINGIKALQQRVEKHGADYDEEQWGQVMDDYEVLSEQAKRCDFTQSQLAELERAEQDLQLTMAQKCPKELGREVGKIIKESGKVINDFLKGLEEGLSEGGNDE